MYTPIKEELEALGFYFNDIYATKTIPGGSIYYSFIVEGFRENSSFSIYFYGSGMGAKEIYPQSIEDVKTLIRILTPQ